MPTRREFLGRGLGALTLGVLARKGFGAHSVPEACVSTTGHVWRRSDPILRLPLRPQSVEIDGLPFPNWFTGDGFGNYRIPFHFITDWFNGGSPPEEQLAFRRYAEVVTYMADKAYPDIPLPDDPKEVARIHALDRKTFRKDVEEQMGMPMPPLLDVENSLLDAQSVAAAIASRL